jgi:MFS family permease
MKSSYGYIIIAAAFIIHLTSYSVYDSYGVFINPWLDDFQWSRTIISGAYSLSFILVGTLAIVMGIMTDKYGPRLTLSICAVCLGAGFLLMSQMQTQWQLYIFYGVIFGIGMSGVWVPVLSLVSRWFPDRRSLMTGIVISGGGLGAFIGPPIIAGLINTHNWRNSSLILGVFTLLVVLLAAQFLKRDPVQVRQLPPDKNNRQEQGLELKVQSYSMKEALQTAQFWIIFSIFFCIAFYTFSMFVHIMPHAIQLGIQTSSAAYILGSISGMGIIGNYVMGAVCDRIGPRNIFIISFIMMSAALFWLAQASEIWMFYVFSVIFGFSHGGNAPAQAPVIAGMFGVKAHGSIFGLAHFGFTLGGALGPLVTGYIFDVTGRYQPAFILCGVIGVIGLVLAITLRPAKRQDAVL